MPTKVWSYGCRQPSAAARELLDAQFRLAHEYYNKLVEIHRKRIAAVRDARLKHSARLTAATEARNATEAELDAVRTQIKQAKAARHRGQEVDLPALNARAKELRGR